MKRNSLAAHPDASRDPEAFRRERQIKQIKEWRRKWKLELIEERNPQWKDLSETMNMWA